MNAAPIQIFQEQRNAAECALLLNQAVTSADLEESVMTVLERHLAIDHFSVFARSKAKPAELLLAGSGTRTGASRAIALLYAERHQKSDAIPANDAQTPEAGQLIVRRRRAAEVRDSRYRRDCYDDPGIAERLTIGWAEPGAWKMLHLYRNHESPSFDDADIEQAVRAAACITTALSSRKKPDVQPRDARQRLSWFTDGLRNLPTPLSEREIEVCARALAGMTVEGTAIDLGVAPTSVITYRGRAYQKLNISSHTELYNLLL